MDEIILEANEKMEKTIENYIDYFVLFQYFEKSDLSKLKDLKDLKLENCKLKPLKTDHPKSQMELEKRVSYNLY